ncbi:MAG: polysaccharide export protein [Acidobacteria bacterium]|nr:polysaccharide export protein [Acidobacteriota bacterium]
MMNLSTVAFSALFFVSMPVAFQAPSTQSPGPGATQVTVYRIGLEDEIKLVVVGDEQFSNVYRVQTDGSITIPLLGSVMAKGLTAVELQEQIRAALAKDYIKNPQVRADVSKYGSQFVMIQGEVRTPGRIAMTGPMTLMEALSAAGSTTPNAGTVVTIARRTTAEDGSADRDAENVEVRLDELRRGVAGADRPRWRLLGAVKLRDRAELEPFRRESPDVTTLDDLVLGLKVDLRVLVDGFGLHRARERGRSLGLDQQPHLRLVHLDVRVALDDDRDRGKGEHRERNMPVAVDDRQTVEEMDVAFYARRRSPRRRRRAATW